MVKQGVVDGHDDVLLLAVLRWYSEGVTMLIDYA